MTTCCLFVRDDLSAMGQGFFDQAEINGMKSDTYMYKVLQQRMAAEGINMNVQSIVAPEQADCIICLNETEFFTTYKRRPNNKHLFLILTEPPVYNLQDWYKSRHVIFDKVFTYDSDLVKHDVSKYVHINFPIDFSVSPQGNLPTETEFNQKRHASLVAGAIAITAPPVKNNSLLYERYKILNWYQKNDPNALDYFARISPVNKFGHFRGAALLNKINKNITPFIARHLFKRRIAKVYRGAIPGLDKNLVLGQYKFHFCIENSHGIKGLISEKIFDCFAARTIPVYYGAPDIASYIPNNCYILYTDFNNLNELATFLKQMDYNTYLQYLINAGNFLNSPAAETFSIAKFTDKICQELR